MRRTRRKARDVRRWSGPRPSEPCRAEEARRARRARRAEEGAGAGAWSCRAQKRWSTWQRRNSTFKGCHHEILLGPSFLCLSSYKYLHTVFYLFRANEYLRTPNQLSACSAEHASSTWWDLVKPEQDMPEVSTPHEALISNRTGWTAT